MSDLIEPPIRESELPQQEAPRVGFLEKPETRKGTFGQDLALPWLESLWGDVAPITFRGSHKFDFECHDPTPPLVRAEGLPMPGSKWHGGSEVLEENFPVPADVIWDIKSKMWLTFMPFTGFETETLEGYERVQQEFGMPFWFLFIDEKQRLAYGGPLDVLNKGTKKFIPQVYPYKEITVFRLELMRPFFEITKESAFVLKELSNRNTEAYGEA